MSLEENKALVRRFLEQIITHGAEEGATAINDLLAPDFVFHDNSDRVRTRDEYLGDYARMKRALSEERLTIRHLFAEGDLVAARFTVDATHSGEFLGHPPTGNRVHPGETVIYRIADGRIAEFWAHSDTLGIFRELGVLPDDLLRERGVPVPPAAPPPPADA